MTKTKNLALVLFDKYQRLHNELELKDMSYCHVEDEKLVVMLSKLCRWLKKTTISARFDKLNENSWTDVGESEHLTPGVKAKYAEQIKEHLKAKFPTHERWKGLKKKDGWWITMKKEISVHEMTGCPLYLLNKPHSKEVPGSVTDIDMQAICVNMISNDSDLDRYEMRAAILMSWFAAGRGGEVKFNSYSDWIYDPCLGGVDTHWTNAKTYAIYSMVMVPHRRNYVVCFYHAMACYYAVEKGLERSKDYSNGKEWVFPTFSCMKEAEVGRKLTDEIQKCLPKGTLDCVRQEFSVDSMTLGACNVLSANPYVESEALKVRTGCIVTKEQENASGYTDQVLSLIGGMSLNEYSPENEDGLIRVILPGFEFMPESRKEEVEKYMDALYGIAEELPQFLRGGALRPFLRAATAVLIMNYEEMKNDFTKDNKVVAKMERVANEVKLEDPMVPGSPIDVMIQWGRLIWSEFIKGSETTLKTSMGRAVEQYRQDVIGVRREGSIVKMELNNLRNDVKSNREMVFAATDEWKKAALESKNECVKHEAELRRQLAELRKEVLALKTELGKALGSVEMLERKLCDSQDCNNNLLCRKKVRGDGSTEERGCVTTPRQHDNSHDHMKNIMDPKIRMSTFIMDIYDMKPLMWGAFTGSNELPEYARGEDTKAYQHALLLLNVVASKQCKDILATSVETRETLLRAAEQAEKECVEAVMKFEKGIPGKGVSTEEDSNCTAIGLGKRYSVVLQLRS